jgi:hypothetical protein
VTYDLVLAAALWVFVGAIALANGGHLSRQPPLRKLEKHTTTHLRWSVLDEASPSIAC